ncbi:DUF6538 domain-containing protein [Paracoccus sp. S-4012]|uniref:DUF6538 domain-containing protein n=1 Tax=Paracoccus sp. S-4012 TaxID=2665648 RepID=UPI00351B96F6
MAAYLSRSRHGIFYFRWPIPQHLHPTGKRGHVRHSLRTRCPAEPRWRRSGYLGGVDPSRGAGRPCASVLCLARYLGC